jgi:hypothetical protein
MEIRISELDNEEVDHLRFDRIKIQRKRVININNIDGTHPRSDQRSHFQKQRTHQTEHHAQTINRIIAIV